jgi:hypothetical protein
MNIKLGKIADVPNAEIYPHSDPVDVTYVVIFTGIRIEFVKNSDNKNSVHEKMKQSTAVAATPPFAKGNTTIQKH